MIGAHSQSLRRHLSAMRSMNTALNIGSSIRGTASMSPSGLRTLTSQPSHLQKSPTQFLGLSFRVTSPLCVGPTASVPYDMGVRMPELPTGSPVEYLEATSSLAPNSAVQTMVRSDESLLFRPISLSA
ncbi:hypothetical protein BASA83_006663 [Batrachochytrium salamandrivorans]|nr:hypothetical protein BASA83_006663 [Batrachochytrium salamandrivorans]